MTECFWVHLRTPGEPQAKVSISYAGSGDALGLWWRPRRLRPTPEPGEAPKEVPQVLPALQPSQGALSGLCSAAFPALSQELSLGLLGFSTVTQVLRGGPRFVPEFILYPWSCAMCAEALDMGLGRVGTFWDVPMAGSRPGLLVCRGTPLGSTRPLCHGRRSPVALSPAYCSG